jgi:histidinol dehydrogenase
VLSFLRGIHIVECDEAGLAGAAPYIDALGGAEDLAAHVQAVRARIPAPDSAASAGERA